MVTSGRLASAIALSMVSRGVTHTGHPGPCTSSNPSGRSSSRPYRMMVWVWPPQISISTQGQVQESAIWEATARAMCPSRYSSMYFMQAPTLKMTVVRHEHWDGDLCHRDYGLAGRCPL